HYFQYAAKLAGAGKTEDGIAMLRYPHEYRNVLLAEQPNTDFAYVIGRQFLFDAYHLPLLEQLMQSKDKQIAAIAGKSIKEVKYHHRFSSEWVKRLGDGTEESHQRMQTALDDLWPYVDELFEETALEQAMKAEGIGADLAAIKPGYFADVEAVLKAATLQKPTSTHRHSSGKGGVHTEQLGYILAELQYMQRAYPNMTW
ncbi:MAG: phenylacetate-CoA oxygenase subunit PaaC, partial [Phaeodactylibacter sp.]|nr:phenylacetate-CoA oxygenase subunit PaaC [Phaeodactylibacter sp.]